MRLPDSFFEDLKARCDIEELIGSYVTLKRRGSTLVGLCPFHSEKTPSFTVFPSTQNYYCFGCGAGGDAISFVRAIENLDYMDAVRFLCRRCGMSMPEDDGETEARRQLRRRVFEINRAAARFYFQTLVSPAGKAGQDYFVKRRLSAETIKHFGLGYAPDGWEGLTRRLRAAGFSEDELLAARVAARGKNGGLYDYFRNRVMFPILDVSGNVIAFGGRVLGDGEPKYLNSPDTPVFKKSLNLFALNFAKQKAAADGLILAEGYMDVIALHQAGFTTAVATLGTAITQEQARLISRYTKSVVVAYDSDGAGQNATRKAISYLRETGVEVRVLRMTGAKDPDEYIKSFGPERFKKLLTESEGFVEFKLQKAKAGLDLSKPEERLAYLRAATNVLCEVDSPLEREVYAGVVAGETGTAADTLLADIKKRLRARVRTEGSKQLRLAAGELSGRTDKLNPEKAEHLRAATAEERLICLLFFHPDFRAKLPGISPEDFVTALNRRFYEAIAARIDAGLAPELSALGQDFTPQELGRLTRCLTYHEVSSQSLTEADELLSVLRAERQKPQRGELISGSIQEYSEYIRNMGKNQKGK